MADLARLRKSGRIISASTARRVLVATRGSEGRASVSCNPGTAHEAIEKLSAKHRTVLAQDRPRNCGKCDVVGALLLERLPFLPQLGRTAPGETRRRISR